MSVYDLEPVSVTSTCSGSKEKVKSHSKIRLVYNYYDYSIDSEDDRITLWSSMEVSVPEFNKKKQAAILGTYSPGTPDICAKYISMSDSDVLQHVHYEYNAIEDPGVREALLHPKPIPHFSSDGIELYKSVCAEMNSCPIGLVIRNLKKQEINLNYYGVGCKDVRALAIALAKNPYVIQLKLKENFLDDDACFHLGNIFKTNRTLEELDLEGCRIGVTGLMRLIANLKFQDTLAVVNLARNCLGDEGGKLLINNMLRGIYMRKLNLSSNELGIQTAKELIEYFGYKNYLTHLDLSRNRFVHVPTLTKMLTCMAFCEYLEELDLSWNDLHGMKVADSLLKLLVFIRSLTVLNLRNNRLEGDAVRHIIQGLIQATNLRTLDLSSNPLTPEDAIAVLHKMLYSKVKLENLWLENICITNEFLKKLERVQNMKSRKDFVIKYGDLIRNWTVEEPDFRKIILERMHFLTEREPSEHKLDVGVYFLRLNEEFPRPVLVKDLIERTVQDNVPLDVNLLHELANVFAGPKIGGSKSVNLDLIREYINRLWPKKKPKSRLHPRPKKQSKKEDDDDDKENIRDKDHSSMRQIGGKWRAKRSRRRFRMRFRPSARKIQTEDVDKPEHIL